MTKSKLTKRALLVSVLSMLLCLSMLVGSTFAWFTDSVTSGKNKIVAGNLDVELEYSTDATSWNPVGPETNLFQPMGSASKWEPGHTEYVYLRVRNAGSLALKYQFSANVFGSEDGAAEKEYTNVLGTSFKLSNYLVFTQTDGIVTPANREALWIADAAEEKAAMGDLSRLSGKVNSLLPSSDGDVLTLAVYMPTQVGNEANQLTSKKATEGEPTIYLGVNLVATQDTVESDSFGTDYDKNAWLEASATDNHDGTYTTDGKLYVKDNSSFVEVQESETTKGLYTAVESGDKYVANEAALDVAASEGGNIKLMAPINESLDSNEAGVEISSGANLNLDNNAINMTTKDGRNNGIEIGRNVTATLSNGTITINKGYGSSYAAVDTDGGELLIENMKIENTTKDGVTVSASGGNTMTIRNSTITGSYSTYYSNVYCGSGGSTVIIENSTIIGSVRAENNGNITIISGDFTQATFKLADSGKRIVYGGTFAANPKTLGFKLAAGSTATDNGNGTWTVTAAG